MDKETGIKVLKEVIRSGKTTRSYIANEFNVDQSQVSRIVNGKFKRMSGHALEICKFAYRLQIIDQANEGDKKLIPELEQKLIQLAVARPQAAEALNALLSALVDG